MSDRRQSTVNNDMFAFFLQTMKTQLSLCLAPGGECTNPAIRAHSIQNSTVLGLLARDGHVICPLMSATLREGLKIELASVGRNKASTFTGLCARHDHEIFVPIENCELDLTDERHLFLLAYRAALRELHSSIQAALRLQAGFQERIARGLERGDIPSPAGWRATSQLMAAYDTFQYKEFIDDAYSAGDFAAVSHDVVCFNVERPTIAVCSLFSVDHIPVRDDVLRVHLNVLPLSKQKTAVVFSYLREDAKVARSFLKRVLTSMESSQKHELSRLILSSCENFVLSPEYFETWSSQKRDAVVRYFGQTITGNDSENKSPLLDLFGSCNWEAP